jgi:uncharacterized protein
MTTAPRDALVFNVAGLLAEPSGSHRDLAVDGVLLDLGEDLVLAEPLAVRVRVDRTNRGLLVRGRLAASLADTCGRCLTSLEIPLDLPLDEEILPSVDLHSGIPLDTAAEPEAFRLSDHHELDLEPLAREAVQLAAPIAPVCRPDCLGLCPDCGGDRNTGPHDHGEVPVDPRLALLAELRIDEPPGTG